MRRFLSSVCVAVVCVALGVTVVGADPGEDHGHDNFPVPVPSLPLAPPGIDNMQLLDVIDNDGTVNSDLAFFGRYAYVGYFDGFKIVDIRRPGRMQLMSDTKCRANQGDVSVFQARNGRRYLLQSIDRPVTAADCTAVDTPLTQEDELGVTRNRARFGFEGLRMFDVTDPRNPRFVKFYRTACGSHTHTLVPDNRNGTMHAYVSSYPLGGNITPQIDVAAAGPLVCAAPHQKISIVSLPLSDPEAGVVRTKALPTATEAYDPDGPYNPTGGAGGTPIGTAPPMKACHDIQAFLPRNIAVGSCAGDLQYWSIKQRGNPSSADGEAHTLIQREVRVDDPATPTDDRLASFEFMHNATVSWDGKVVTAIDESGGGGAARCDAANTTRGFTYFYPLVEPGTPVDGFTDLLGKYMIPRPQNTEVCVSHNGNVIPVADRYLQTQAFYLGGNTVFDFTDVTDPFEFAWADLETSVGNADSWSTYWYNNVVYVNGGLNRRGATGNRGFESYAVYEDGDRLNADRWRWLNPQTQETWQVPEDLDDEDDD